MELHQIVAVEGCMGSAYTIGTWERWLGMVLHAQQVLDQVLLLLHGQLQLLPQVAQFCVSCGGTVGCESCDGIEPPVSTPVPAQTSMANRGSRKPHSIGCGFLFKLV